jgi:ribosomal protein S18 acetylase RimI-like enzyme
MPAKLSLRLRPITPEDDSFLAGLYTSTRAEELAITGWSDEQKAAFCRKQFDAQSAHYTAHYPGALLQIIEQSGMPIGRLYVAHWEREIRIMDIALLPEHRGAGIGTKFLRELQDEARSAGKPLTIHVERYNPARRLYERLGFKIVEEQQVYLLMQWGGSHKGHQGQEGTGSGLL